MKQVHYIQWRDSGFHISDGWQPVVEALADFKFDDMLIDSSGLLVYEDDDVVALTTSLASGTDSAFGLQIIAKSNITRHEVFNVPSS